MVTMTGRVEIKVVAPAFSEMDALDKATDRAAEIIYALFPKGGPSVAGNTDDRAMTCLFYVDDELPDAWLPQLQVLVRAVEGPIDSVSIEPFVE